MLVPVGLPLLWIFLDMSNLGQYQLRRRLITPQTYLGLRIIWMARQLLWRSCSLAAQVTITLRRTMTIISSRNLNTLAQAVHFRLIVFLSPAYFHMQRSINS